MTSDTSALEPSRPLSVGVSTLKMSLGEMPYVSISLYAAVAAMLAWSSFGRSDGEGLDADALGEVLRVLPPG